MTPLFVSLRKKFVRVFKKKIYILDHLYSFISFHFFRLTLSTVSVIGNTRICTEMLPILLDSLL